MSKYEQPLSNVGSVEMWGVCLPALFTALVLWLLGMSRRIYNLTSIYQSVINWPGGECERTFVLGTHCPQNGSCSFPTAVYFWKLHLQCVVQCISEWEHKEDYWSQLWEGFGEGYRLLSASRSYRSQSASLFDPTLGATSWDTWHLPSCLLLNEFTYISKGSWGQCQGTLVWFTWIWSQHSLILQIEILFKFFFINILFFFPP